MKIKKFGKILAALICVASISSTNPFLVSAAGSDLSAVRENSEIKEEQIRLIPGGVPFGVKLYCEGVLVVGLADVKFDGKTRSPARDAGIKEKDIITEINGIKMTTVDDVVNAVSESSGEPIIVKLNRDGNELKVKVTPIKSDEDGKFKTGLWVRDSTAGIGTVTFIDPECGSFAGLGHGICDADTGELMPLNRGIVVNVVISSVVKGQAGYPGELKGYFSSGKIGTLLGNTECGVFGIFAEYPSGTTSESLPIAYSNEIIEGEATILCTTDSNGIGSYKENISNIDHSGRDIKNFVITVTDENLINKTGGIVQGMSGSPIIQNGKIIGAVTHVLINNPTKGYGIFIENMLANIPEIIK
jgi:stage IV sporulation protein B